MNSTTHLRLIAPTSLLHPAMPDPPNFTPAKHSSLRNAVAQLGQLLSSSHACFLATSSSPVERITSSLARLVSNHPTIRIPQTEQDPSRLSRLLDHSVLRVGRVLAQQWRQGRTTGSYAQRQAKLRRRFRFDRTTRSQTFLWRHQRAVSL
jgi:hypothetical protein